MTSATLHRLCSVDTCLFYLNTVWARSVNERFSIHRASFIYTESPAVKKIHSDTDLLSIRWVTNPKLLRRQNRHWAALIALV